MIRPLLLVLLLPLLQVLPAFGDGNNNFPRSFVYGLQRCSTKSHLFGASFELAASFLAGRGKFGVGRRGWSGVSLGCVRWLAGCKGRAGAVEAQVVCGSAQLLPSQWSAVLGVARC